MNKILITGSSGFIGTNLVSKLIEIDENIVLGLDLNPPKIIEHKIIWKNIDIRDKEALSNVIEKFNPSFIIHLAARTDLNGKTIEDYDSNTIGVSNLLEVLEELKNVKRVIFASSMYVCIPGYSPSNFEDYKPHTIYGESKVLTEKIVKKENLGYNWCIIRPTSIWGPFFSEPYADFFKIVLSKKYFHMGKKACSKTYGYIDNTVYQIIELLNADSEKINKKVFYIGDWPKYNISEWADEIAEYSNFKIPKIPFLLFRFAGWFGDILKIIGVKFPMTSFRLKNMTTDNVHDLSLIKEIAPNLPVNRVDGVKRTVNWINKTKK